MAVEDTSKITLRGYTFSIKSSNGWRTATYYDAHRNYKPVAEVTMPEAARNDATERNIFNRAVARILLNDYNSQYKMRELKLTFMEGMDLSEQEMKEGKGIDEVERREPKKPEVAKPRRRSKGS